MKQFYDACNQALAQSRKGYSFGALAWLVAANKAKRRIQRQARARLEVALVDHVERYFQTSLRAIELLWADRPYDAAVEWLCDESTVLWQLDRAYPWPVWDKTVSRGSLAYRWSQHREGL